MGVTSEKGCSPAMDVLASGGQIVKMRIDEKFPVNGALLSLFLK